MHSSSLTSTIEPSEFFVLRTPLLPLDLFLNWSGLPVNDSSRYLEIQGNFEQQAQSLSERLKKILNRREIREAIFLASSEVESALSAWLSDNAGVHTDKIQHTLIKYFTRMCARATPYGLFAGCATGIIGDETHLVVDGSTPHKRTTRLDLGYVQEFLDHVATDPTTRISLRYLPNSSSYVLGNRLVYVEARKKGRQHLYHLVAVEHTEELNKALCLAEKGATPLQLAMGLTDSQVDVEEAKEYVSELIDAQVITPELSPTVTGDNPVAHLIKILDSNDETKSLATVLHEATQSMAALDKEGIGNDPQVYRDIALKLNSLSVPFEVSKLFQVDLIKNGPAVLGRRVADELLIGADTLYRVTPKRNKDPLQAFRRSFVERYESREVRLVEALDEETGIGFQNGNSTSGGSTLLQGLALRLDKEEQTQDWTSRDSFLLQRVEETFSFGKTELLLNDSDIEKLSASEHFSLPPAFAVMATLASNLPVNSSLSDFQVLLHGVSGPSGARLLGRFCHSSDSLRSYVQEHIRKEEALDPETIYAEIIHFPGGRAGNVIMRPQFRQHEIPFLGRSCSSSARQIPVDDIFVRIAGDWVILTSRTLNREIRPRLTCAHTFGRSSLSLYRFLGAVQDQESGGSIAWDWGRLVALRQLPRVRYGKYVFARARWSLAKPELDRLRGKNPGDRVGAAIELRKKLNLPRFVVLADGDNELLIDFENVLSIEVLAGLLKNRSGALLLEFFPNPEQLCATGREGRFVHEVIVPYVRNSNQKQVGTKLQQHSTPAVCRTFPPASEWLYVKIFTGHVAADSLLKHVIKPVVEQSMRCGAADRWFFIRYADQGWHIRLRIHGDPTRLLAEILPLLRSHLDSYLSDGRVSSVQLDTYQREIERYGGDAGISLSEELFHIDSVAAVAIIEGFAGDDALDKGWRLALRGTDMLLTALRCDIDRKLRIVARLREQFAGVKSSDKHFKLQLGTKYRDLRSNIEQLLDPAYDVNSNCRSGILVLNDRSKRLGAIADELVELERQAKLSVSREALAASYVHMQINRLLRSAHRAHEIVIYDFLSRVYMSQLKSGKVTYESA